MSGAVSGGGGGAAALARRLRRVAAVVGGRDHRDPSLFVLAFALWMLFSAATLLAPGDALEASPVYAIALEIGLREVPVGLGMLLDGLLLLWVLGQARPRVPAWLALASGGLWCFWSLLMLFSALRVGLFSTSAAWMLAASLLLLQASVSAPAAAAPDGREPAVGWGEAGHGRQP